MKMNRHMFAMVGLVLAALLFSSSIFAQRGYYGHGRGYAYGHSYRSYPTVHYSPARYYSPVRYYPERVYYSNHPYTSLYFGGIGYRYQGGYFYRPYGSSFQVAIAPFGIRISTLPLGYSSFYIGPTPYYYYGGTYYRPYSGNQYQVVKPPLGAVVNSLPSGAKATVIDGKKYYEQSGTYYEESINDHNKLHYTVVGTDGVLNTGNNSSVDNNRDNDNSPIVSGPSVGDRFDDLPSDSKAVVINGQKLYLSPTGLYYKEVIDGNKVTYEVVGE